MFKAVHPPPTQPVSLARVGRRELPGGGPVSLALIVLERETSAFSGVSLVASRSPPAPHLFPICHRGHHIFPFKEAD